MTRFVAPIMAFLLLILGAACSPGAVSDHPPSTPGSQVESATPTGSIPFRGTFDMPRGWHELDGAAFLPETQLLEFAESDQGDLVVVSVSNPPASVVDPEDFPEVIADLLMETFDTRVVEGRPMREASSSWVPFRLTEGNARVYATLRQGLVIAVLCQGDWEADLSTNCLGVLRSIEVHDAESV